MRGAKGSRLARIFNSRQTLSKALPSILTIPDSLSSAFSENDFGGYLDYGWLSGSLRLPGCYLRLKVSPQMIT